MVMVMIAMCIFIPFYVVYLLHISLPPLLLWLLYNLYGFLSWRSMTMKYDD
jgi:hypothetical protein